MPSLRVDTKSDNYADSHLPDRFHSFRRRPFEFRCLASEPATYREGDSLPPMGEHGVHLREVHVRATVPGAETQFCLHDVGDGVSPPLFRISRSPRRWNHSLVLDDCVSPLMGHLRHRLPIGSSKEMGRNVLVFLFVQTRAHFVYNVILLLFGIPTLVFTLLLVVKLEFLPSLHLFLVFLPLLIMDCIILSFHRS